MLLVVGLAASVVVPRFRDPRALAIDAAARRLADTLDYARDRAILGGVPMRVVLDLDAGRWTVGRAGREATDVAPGASLVERPWDLPREVQLRSATAGDGVPVRAGVVALDLDPAGDALPARVELGDAEGRVAVVRLPAAGARAAVDAGAAG